MNCFRFRDASAGEDVDSASARISGSVAARQDTRPVVGTPEPVVEYARRMAMLNEHVRSSAKSASLASLSDLCRVPKMMIALHDLRLERNTVQYKEGLP